MAAFQNALAQGCNMMETDVLVTKDNVVVCIHDNDIERLTGVDANFSDYNFADLPPYQSSYKYVNQEGSYTQTSDDDGQWLKLEDLLSAMPNTMLFHIDLKSSDPSHATFVNDVVVAAGAEDRVKWGSFKY